MQTKKDTVLIAGATGYLGQHLITAYAQAGYSVRALVRNPEKLIHLEHLTEDVFIGEATNAETLGGCCDDIDLVISALGITRQTDGLSYQQVDYQANSNILREAIKAGVKRFSYVHVLGAEKMPHVAMVKAKSKFAAELERAPIASTILCPSGFYSDMAEFMRMAEKGRIYLFGNGQAKLSPIHGADLATMCVHATEQGLAKINIGGPKTFTQNQIAALAFREIGQTERVTHIPICLGRMSICLAKLFGFKSNVGSLEFFLRASELDMSAPPYGHYQLRDSFKELALRARKLPS